MLFVILLINNSDHNYTKQNLKNKEQFLEKDINIDSVSDQGIEKKYYFGYGSNMDIDLLRRRLNNPSLVPVSSGLLKEYRLIFPRGVGSVAPDENYDVYGCVYLLTEEEIKKLDVIEGYSEDRERSLNSYNRNPIEIILPNSENITAEIYIQVNDREDLPSNNYKQTIIKGANDCNLPREYINWLEELEIN